MKMLDFNPLSIGYYREYIAPELLALVLNEVVERVNLDVTLVDDVITGYVYQIGEQGFNLARMGILSSRLPVTLGGISVNRQCGSSLSAIQLGAGIIAAGTMRAGITRKVLDSLKVLQGTDWMTADRL